MMACPGELIVQALIETTFHWWPTCTFDSITRETGFLLANGLTRYDYVAASPLATIAPTCTGSTLSNIRHGDKLATQISAMGLHYDASALIRSRPALTAFGRPSGRPSSRPSRRPTEFLTASLPPSLDDSRAPTPSYSKPRLHKSREALPLRSWCVGDLSEGYACEHGDWPERPDCQQLSQPYELANRDARFAA